MSKPCINASEHDELVKKKLAITLRYAYENSPFYHNIFVERGLKPEDIKSPEQLLTMLPIIDKVYLANNAPPKGNFELYSAPNETNTILYTSGSTGMPKIISTSETDFQIIQKDCRIMYTMLGIKKGDTILDMFPFGINSSEY